MDFHRCPMVDFFGVFLSNRMFQINCKLHTLDQFESAHDLVQHLAQEGHGLCHDLVQPKYLRLMWI
jgi:hypothetical protein